MDRYPGRCRGDLWPPRRVIGPHLSSTRRYKPAHSSTCALSPPNGKAAPYKKGRIRKLPRVRKALPFGTLVISGGTTGMSGTLHRVEDRWGTHGNSRFVRRARVRIFSHSGGEVRRDGAVFRAQPDRVSTLPQRFSVASQLVSPPRVPSSPRPEIYGAHRSVVFPPSRSTSSHHRYISRLSPERPSRSLAL